MSGLAQYKGYGGYTFKSHSADADKTDFWDPAAGKSIVIRGWVASVIATASTANYLSITDGTNEIARLGGGGGATGGTNWVATGLDIRLPADAVLQLLEEGTITAYHVTVWGYEV